MIRSRGVTGACSICFVLLVAQQSLLLALSSSYAAEAAVHNLLLEPAASKNKVELERSHNTWSRDSTWKRDKSPKSVNVPEISEDKHDHANSICSSINDYLEKNYNSSCELVKQICGDAYELFDYLRFVTCDIGRPVGYIFLITWLLYLLLLLSTTVDDFFIPVLQLLGKKLHLSPSTTGMTLLALGNGAPDIFIAFSALQGDNFALMLGSLMGAGLFIVAVVLGTILMIAPSKTYNINPINFMRDLLSYVVVLVIIAAVTVDGKVTLAEGICFPILYIGYIALVLTINYLKKLWAESAIFRRFVSKKKKIFTKKDDRIVFGKESYSKKKEANIKESGKFEKTYSITTKPLVKKEKLELVGLTIPKRKIATVLFILMWPFSLLRWLTIPPCSHDGRWSTFHFFFAAFSPTPMALFVLVGFMRGWSGYTKTVGDFFPVAAVVGLCAVPFSVVLLIVLSRKHPPHWFVQAVLMIAAFAMCIAWLNVIANEIVSVLQALGLLVGISTAIMGLTVLAIGNSIVDWVTNSVVARKGVPEMALASCFGGLLITCVMGLSLALIPKILKNGAVYQIDIGNLEFDHLKLAWIFLGIVLLSSAVIFPLFKFNPPKEYGLVLMYVYLVFMTFSVLVEADILNMTLTWL